MLTSHAYDESTIADSEQMLSYKASFETGCSRMSAIPFVQDGVLNSESSVDSVDIAWQRLTTIDGAAFRFRLLPHMVGREA